MISFEKYLETIDIQYSRLLKFDKEYDEFILTEGISSIVFHWTPLTNSLSIVSTGTLKLSDAKNLQDFEEEWLTNKFGKGKKYFLSTSRNRVSGFSEPRIIKNQPAVVFEFDGKRLMNITRNSIASPVRFTSYGLPKEQEDRIFSDNDSIKKIWPSIIRVHCLLPPKKSDVSKNIKKIYVMLSTLKHLGIPIKIYISGNDFINKRDREETKQLYTELYGEEFTGN